MKIRAFVILILALQFVACGTTKTIRIESNPAGANVFLNDKKVGASPFDISDSKFKEEFKRGFLEVKLQAKGYEPKNILISTKANQTMKVNLQPYTDDYFAKTVLAEFQASGNQMVRELLQVQGLIVAKMYPQAEEKLKNFMVKYPNIAAGYVLQANLEMNKNEKDQALRNLQRALSLDADDPVVTRMVENLKKASTQ